MLSLNCKICGQLNPENSHFWKNHNIRIELYFQQYYGFRDKLSNQLLPFTSTETYFLNQFSDRDNLRAWFKQATKEDKVRYIRDYLSRRMDIKDIIFLPSAFEVRSLQLPTINYIEKNLGAGVWNNIGTEVGLKIKYDYNQKLEFDLDKNINWIIDTREQSLISTTNKRIETLNFGDYTIEDNIQGIWVEKKSLNDFCGTLSKGFDRFGRELERCKQNNGYLIILVDEKFSNLKSIKYLPHTRNIRATSDFILHRAREILNSFPLNCQILCVDGKREASRILDKIFRLKNDIRTVDLIFYYDNALL